ncbi:ras-like protein family member 11B [Salvelinus alpinus]|uniref:small monomeric GTPase n=1 Tax=Salvelinus namaycush TaxID=8040 RepID=A0A8U1C1Q1_SALNM|nr:ras-like protein family member 11B [Salvelinus alpinus]XP_038858590.1 ras-like protein family member 11B [Salvelinus namaycush]XP_055800191.1 ras-like protein family member 11B [Salvelinus fontinalis]
MRLIQNMSTIAEFATPECLSNRTIKIAVIGGSGVGKTALVVRFLTRRFIGDYERNAGNLYSREVQVDGEQAAIQVQDTPGVDVTCNGLSLPDHVTCSIQWADAVVLVYSVTDRHSFDLIGQLHQLVARAGGANVPPVILLANKADLLHMRRVDAEQGPLLAAALGCSFYEVSASEDYSQVHGAFHRLCCHMAKQQPQASLSSHTTTGAGEKKGRSPLIPRPKSPNMQDLKRRFKQALSAKVRTVTSV